MYSGGISESHYRGFTDTGRARIELVWDIDPERAGEAAARWGAKVASGKHVLRKTYSPQYGRCYSYEGYGVAQWY